MGSSALRIWSCIQNASWLSHLTQRAKAFEKTRDVSACVCGEATGKG